MPQPVGPDKGSRDMPNFIANKVFMFKTGGFLGRLLGLDHLRPRASGNEKPLRAELFGLEQLTRHAKALAAAHKSGIKAGGGNPLLARLDENEKILQAFNRSTLAVDEVRRVTPAAEWLLDNFYLIEEQIQMARRHLPRNYSAELPRLSQGLSAKLPRIYDLILELISHVDAQIDADRLSAFIAAYQTVTPLNLGELWAVPIMLRLGLIENLRRMTTRLAADRRDRDLADFWAGRLEEILQTDPSSLIVVVAEMAKSKCSTSSAFVAEFSQRLSRLDPAAHFAREWLEKRLTEQGVSVEQLVLIESQGQAADQVSISHTIGSLRFLGANDWRDFVESLSVVEQTLRNDPAGIHRQMDFATRDHYRHRVEQIARHSRMSENEVAWKAIDLAERAAAEKGREDRSAHTGYWLIDKGQELLAGATGARWPWPKRMEQLARKFPLAFYAGGIGLILASAMFFLVWRAELLDLDGWKLILLAILLLVCVSQLAVSLMNWLSTVLISPKLLPRLDFSEGIAPDCRTMVVVPTLLAGLQGIDHLLETLEIHYLANQDKNLYFALLTDFRDSPQETVPEDDVLLARIARGIEGLNGKYQSDRPNIFFLFHRPRRWNEAEGIWMGYERKRGKLAEFNHLLRGGCQECFARIVGDTFILPGIRFVITLDTDTQLPRDAARRLVGTISHPLNRPRFDPEKGIVHEGYGILQPRVGVSLPSAGRSWFVRIFAGDAGIDPYTRMVSDVYQDIFNEGSFIGKGIYDVDAFEQAVQGRFPENTILSHDLLESLHARSALVSDVELYEEHPSRYNADTNRRHRWIRGDWQIAQWLLPRVPGADARQIANPLSGLSQWKIFDNLRRSLVPAALVLLLLGNWILLPQLRGLGPLLVLTIMILPGLLSALAEVMGKPGEWPLWLHLKSTAGSFARQFAQIALTLVFLPYDAYVSLDAIIRTLARLTFTHKKLLEWQTSSDAERSARMDIGSFYRTMWIAPVLAAATLVYLALKQPDQLPFAVPFLVAWLGAPWIAWWISQPIAAPTPRLAASQLAFLGRTARKTWRFFETFVTEQENWLPPDNFQEKPAPLVASRTSPTNMGLALLANLSACDFGYITVDQLIERTRNTLSTMQRLERHRGHFYNWYDTRSLQPLPPHYVSTVDSGNLAGHLLILNAGLREYVEGPLLNLRLFQGLRDTLGVLRELTGGDSRWEKLDHALAHPPTDLPNAHATLRQISHEASKMTATLAGASPEVKWWVQTFVESCQAHLKDLIFLAPWLPAMEELIKPAGNSSPEPFSHNGHSPPPSSASLNSTFQDEPRALQILRGRLPWLGRIPTLREVSELPQSLGLDLEQQLSEMLPAVSVKGAGNPWDELLAGLAEGSRRALARAQVLEDWAGQAMALANMDVSFLFDPVRNLFTIGYNVDEHRRDAGFYDLLASESRFGSFVAIAQGQVPQKHWFSLGRLLAAARGEPVLVSWSGSMFEYLMPSLVMPAYENTLLDQTCHAAVRAQIDYGRQRGTPWGISEAGYNLVDTWQNYQYRAFGVPGLGFKRGLADDLVIAPYASALALMVAPKSACENLERLAAENRLGSFGFHESVDYTPSRLPPNETSVTIRSFMAHHQAMSLLSFAHLLLGRPMQRRFLSHPPFKAGELLLQERVPKAITTLSSEDVELGESRGLIGGGEGIARVFTTPRTPVPEVHLLSNGRYHVMVSNAGGGYSRWQNLAVTRWREDATRDAWGNFCYVRDLESGEFWSVAHQPALKSTDRYEAIFTQARAEFRQRHHAFEVHTEISVSPEDDLELRRVTLTNHSSLPRVLELTTYAEVVLAPAAADAAHPAFSNLFVQTEFVSHHPALLCTRRARAPGENPPWLLHLMIVHGSEQGEMTFETDRAKFVGRGRTPASPAALRDFSPLSNSTGSVLDPIVSLRRAVTIAPESAVQIDIVLGITESRETALALVEKYHTLPMADRLFDLAWTHSQVTLRHLDASEADAQLYARIAGALIYADLRRRASSSVLLANQRGQHGLWSYGISGDLPLVLLRISDADKMELVRRVVQAHAYWRLKGLAVELIILNEDSSGYRQALQERIVGIIAAGLEAQMLDKPGGIFVRRLEQIPAEDRILLQSVARVIFSDDKGSLEEQLDRRPAAEPGVPLFEPTRFHTQEVPAALPSRELIFFNGLGGFTGDGREYIITLPSSQPVPVRKKNSVLPRFASWRGERFPAARREGGLNVSPDPNVRKAEKAPPSLMTPAPWINVLANPRFGTAISESGGAYTWFENSHEFRLTPWNNDPVSDVSGESFYIRDDETGEFWSPTPLPARGISPHVIRHGFGYTVFEHSAHGIGCETWVYVATDAPVKFTVIKLRNLSGRPRRLSVFGYWEWVLGDLREKSLMHIRTEVDEQTNALLARNPYHSEFAGHVAFVDVDSPGRTVTGDRTEFLGRNGTPADPAALQRAGLSGKTGAGLDPCAALQVTLELPGRAAAEVTFRLGAGGNLVEARELIQRFQGPRAAQTVLEEVWTFWERNLGAMTVETPDPAINVLANGWLMYQTLSARLWGRTGFYQSGGAFGFRDQLQDAMATVHVGTGLLREQIMRAARHQFREGDVQHWWHPPSGRGVRTHFSDDYLWLPYSVCRYLTCSDDTGVLDEVIPFLEGRALKPEEESYYDLPTPSEESGTLYEHCVRAIKNGLKFGEHGLPLIGCGDWNDGLNLVGAEGRGESVWLAFFLLDLLMRFAGVARRRQDHDFADRCLAQAALLRQNIELHAWDGDWYRRAYFDNGEPLGSRANPECQIDSLPQSWSVISHGGNLARSRRAMKAVNERLVRRNAGIIQLFDPPFDKSPVNPGYIKGYVPGVRENGGQYTHAAIWTVMAFAQLGEIELAWGLFALLNPVNHGNSPSSMATYKVEPYVVAADIYAVAPHVGRGGWTWYTGSAGWMYQLVTETLLGLNLEGDKLRIQPRLPKDWREFKVHYRHHSATYHITVKQTSEVLPGTVQTDETGRHIAGNVVLLIDDNQEHHVTLLFDAGAPPEQSHESAALAPADFQMQ